MCDKMVGSLHDELTMLEALANHGEETNSYQVIIYEIPRNGKGNQSIFIADSTTSGNVFKVHTEHHFASVIRLW